MVVVHLEFNMKLKKMANVVQNIFSPAMIRDSVFNMLFTQTVVSSHLVLHGT